VFGSPRGPPPASQLPLPPPPPLIPQTRSARGRNSQTPMASLPSPSAYHRQLGGRNYGQFTNIFKILLFYLVYSIAFQCVSHYC
jgi:hypothetical protein